MPKLIQICASQNDLFGLDDDGMVHRYNFNTNTWMRIDGGKPLGDEQRSGVFGSANAHRDEPPDADRLIKGSA
jgi:hypothetical protein